MDWFVIAVIGLLCGYLNSMSSGGSALALPALLLLGIPAHVANGSNRIGLLVAGATRIAVFQKAGRIRWREWSPAILSAMMGALLGASIEHRIPEKLFGHFIPFVLVGSLALLLIGMKRFLRTQAFPKVRIRPIHLLIASLVGVWNGIIAIEAAAMYLILFVIGPGLTLQDANILKANCVFIGATVSSLIFAGLGQISWSIAIALACGNLVGSHLGARHALREGAQVWVYRLAVIALTIELFWYLRVHYSNEIFHLLHRGQKATAAF
jgi:uncharacterized protein